ncbi:MAG: M23 family metallopeptidase [Solirubrobacterales bacterium]
MSIPVLIARVRAPLMWLFFAAVIASVVIGVSIWIALGLFVAALVANLWLGTVRREPTRVGVPVVGRWQAMNSPADRVPSHYLHTYGQTYAIDFLCEPEDRPRPAFGSRPAFRRPEDFPGYGQKVLAPAAGTVVRTVDDQRDHRARNSALGVLFVFVVESAPRELLGPSRILGNHVVLDLGDGVYSALAHLRRGSLGVAEGDRVEAGDPIAECGNSGNSTEPHLHFQLMDSPRTLFAAGLPFEFDRFEVNGRRERGVPGKDEPFVAPTAQPMPI